LLLAQPNKHSITLSWQANEDANCRGTIVEKGESPSAFKPLRWVAPQSVAKTGSRHELIDSAAIPGVRYYYRYREMYFDGSVRASNVASAILDGGNSFAARIYPNPTHGQLTIHSYLPNTQSIPHLTVRIFTVLGVEVLTQNIPAAAGNSVQSLNVEALSAGTYFVVIQAGLESRSFKLIRIE
jgi:hypothetical protein